jgi:predicted DNA binding CopG/RHH family protein
MDDFELDEEEREILEAFESGQLTPVSNKEEVIARLQSYAQGAQRKDRRVNIRLTAHDLASLQAVAVEEGIPYQTLMASILHKYVTGRLVERPRSMPQRVEAIAHEERKP